MVSILTCDKNQIQIKEKDVLYYMGAKENTEQSVQTLLKDCIEKTQKSLSPKACFDIFPVKIENSNIDFGVMSLNSSSLAKNLRHCDKAIIFTATVGFETERLIQRYSKISPAHSTCISACATSAIEEWCDILCCEFSKLEEADGSMLRPRFSPGYGDLDISAQKIIADILDTNRKIGVSLTGALLMLPTKSVSAIVGIEKNYRG